MASLRKRALPSGKVVWQVDYRDNAAKRRHRQFVSKREADGFMVQARAEVAAGTHTPESQSITVGEAAALWLDRCRRDDLEQTTIDAYKNHVDLHIVPRIGQIKLARLTTPLANEFRDRLVADGRSRDMAKRVIGSLSAIVSEAQQRGLVAVNNVHGIRRRRNKSEREDRKDRRAVAPTKDELKAIINKASGRQRPLILTAIFTGLRASELRGLTWGDLDLKEAVLHVRRRVDRYNKFGTPKSKAGVRDIPLSPVVVNTLREWKLVCPKGELDLIFPTGSGTVEGHANILHRVFWPLQLAAGVIILRRESDGQGGWTEVPDAKYSLHALRHAAAALWIEQGLSPKRIQALMGHASIQQTFDRYGYLFEALDQDHEAMAAIEARLLR